jgi:hypothetical protein
MPVGKSKSHPSGILFSGDYDTNTNELVLASEKRDPRGVALQVLIVDSGTVYWAGDSIALSDEQSAAVQVSLEKFFTGNPVKSVAKLEDIPQKSRKSTI